MGHLFFNNRGFEPIAWYYKRACLLHGIIKGHAYRMPADVNSTSNPVT